MPLTLLKQKINQFNQARDKTAEGKVGLDKIAVLIQYDASQKLTTNRIQLESVGIDCSDVKKNLKKIIQALKLIGVNVVVPDRMPKAIVASKLSNAMNERVPEMWGPKDMSEFLELDPQGHYPDLVDVPASNN